MDILLSDINKTYLDHGNKRVIFRNMTACFPSGQFFVVIGKSGVGKSSLLNLISGIDVPDKGVIQIGNTRVSDMTDNPGEPASGEDISVLIISFLTWFRYSL